MILTYRLLNGKEDLDYRKFFVLSETQYDLRCHSRKLVRTFEHLNVRRNFFSKRIIEKWNSLTDHEVTAPSTAIFKERYDIMEESRQRISQTGIYVRQRLNRTGISTT